MDVTVTIVSDFICPWCLVGERRLQQAIARLPDGAGVSIRWLPFQLNPDMPASGMDRKTYRARKFGSLERSDRLDRHTVDASRDTGIAFDYGAILRTPNTLKAHRLMAWAGERGADQKLAPAILSAYFEHGQDIGEAAVLGSLAAKAGLSQIDAEDFLATDEGTEEVRAAARSVMDRGVRGVPYFEIDGRVVNGAQSVDDLLNPLLSAYTRVCSLGPGDWAFPAAAQTDR